MTKEISAVHGIDVLGGGRLNGKCEMAGRQSALACVVHGQTAQNNGDTCAEVMSHHVVVIIPSVDRDSQ